jgi:hypothetical protein
MKDDIDIESNMMTSVKLKTKFEMGTREPKRFKEHAGPYRSGKYAEEKCMRWLKLLNIYQTKFPRWKWKNPSLIHMLEIKSA